MTEEIFQFQDGVTRRSRGRGYFNADAVGVGHNRQEHTIYLFNRVQSSGNLDFGWVALPDHPDLLRCLAKELQTIADNLQ